MFSCFFKVGSDGKGLVTQGRQGMLRFALQNEHPKQRHDVVTQHGKCEGRFCSIKIIEVETTEPKIVFQFLDSVFGIGSVTVYPPDFCG